MADSAVAGPEAAIRQVVVVPLVLGDPSGGALGARPSRLARLWKGVGYLLGAGSVTTLAAAVIPVLIDGDPDQESPDTPEKRCVQVLEQVQDDVEDQPDHARVLIARDATGRTFVKAVEFEQCGRNGEIAQTIQETLEGVGSSPPPTPQPSP